VCPVAVVWNRSKVTWVCSFIPAQQGWQNKWWSRCIINHPSSVYKISTQVVTLNQGLRQQYSPWPVLPPPTPIQYKKKVRWPTLNRDYAVFLLIYINSKVIDNASQHTIQPDNKNSLNQRFICCLVWVFLREQTHNPTHLTVVYTQHTVTDHTSH
jgi:hypothetical protein